MADVLTLHRGGADPVELERLEEDAAVAMSALAAALPAADERRDLFSNVATVLELRRSRRELRRRRDAIKRDPGGTGDAA